jgi:predicted small integral membrane protein
VTILATSKTTRIPGPATRINCPKCGPNTPALSYTLVEKMGVFFIPLFTQRETYLECARCGSARLVNVPLEGLGRYKADELDAHVFQRMSIVVKFLALASVLLACVPFLGLGFGLFGFWSSYRTGGWVKVVSIVGIVLSTLGTTFMLVAMMSAKGT